MKTIIDVSPAVYGGHHGNDRRICGFPVGGIRKVMGIINSGLSYSDYALCFDGGNIIKKELLPTYKAGRVPDYSVLAQIDLLKELLTDCNIPFYCDDRYEADDYIFSICRELAMLGDPENVVIYTNDRDVACCVTDQNSIKNVTSQGICIDINNYEDRVVDGKNIPYNSILLWKIFHGDPSDNYKALRIPGLTFQTFCHEFITALEPLIEEGRFTKMAYAEYPVFEVIARNFENSLSSEHLNLLLKQGRLAYPYSVPVSTADTATYLSDMKNGDLFYTIERRHMKLFGNGTFDRKKFDMYCSLLGLNQLKASRLVDKDSIEAQKFYSLLELRAKELSSGLLAVERYRNKRVVVPHEETLPNMELPI